jgi:hypothetical protein
MNHITLSNNCTVAIDQRAHILDEDGSVDESELADLDNLKYFRFAT